MKDILVFTASMSSLSTELLSLTSDYVVEDKLNLNMTQEITNSNGTCFVIRTTDKAQETFIISLINLEIIGYDNYKADFDFINVAAKAKFESVYSRVSYQQTIDNKTVTIKPPLKPFSFGEPPLSYQVQQFKQQRAKAVEAIKVDVVIGANTVSLDGDETSQNRLARAGLGMLAAKLFAIETVLKTSTTTSAKTLRRQLVSALDSIKVNVEIPWIAADNSLTTLDSKTVINALTKAGQAQQALWIK